MRSWDIGSASQLETARRYTAEHPRESPGWIALADAMWSWRGRKRPRRRFGKRSGWPRRLRTECGNNGGISFSARRWRSWEEDADSKYRRRASVGFGR
jgi:hypothetical protein